VVTVRVDEVAVKVVDVFVLVVLVVVMVVLVVLLKLVDVKEVVDDKVTVSVSVCKRLSGCDTKPPSKLFSICKRRLGCASEAPSSSDHLLRSPSGRSCVASTV